MSRRAPAARNALPIEPERLSRAKLAYTTRRVPLEAMAALLAAARRPRPGDVVLARVARLGQHEHLELQGGRRAALYPGDEIVVAFGNRYAPDQYEAIVPEGLAPCHLVAAGGIAAQMLHKHSKMRDPTTIVPVGLVADARGRRTNLADWAIERKRPDPDGPRPLSLLIAGTSMNSGKTTAISNLTRGLIAAGLKVAAAKVSGTGAGGDHWRILDAGAEPTLDFVDAGVASTYRLPPEEADVVVDSLLACLFAAPVDVVLLEVSDGLLEPETGRLLSSPGFQVFVDGVVFTATDALGAAGGVAWLRERELPVVAVSGVLTSSPLAMRETVGAAEIPVVETQSLTQAEVASMIRDCAATRRTAAGAPPGAAEVLRPPAPA